jgi:HEAT repeat protein
LSSFLLHILIYIILILLCLTYLLILYVINLRLYHDYYSRKQKTFTEEWEETIFKYLQLRGDPEELIKKVPRRKYLFLLELLRGFLISLTGSEYEKIADIIRGKRIYDYLIKGLNSYRISRIITSAYFLGIAKVAKSKELIANKLDTKSEFIFINCATSLAQMNAVEYADKILAKAESFKRINRDTLLFILLEYKRDACTTLLKLLPGIMSDYQKESIISLFRHFQYQESAPEVTKTLVNSFNTDLIQECLKFLREVRYTESEETIIKLLDHKSPMVRVEAIKTIGKLGTGPLDNLLLSKVSDENYEVQLAAADTISTDIPEGYEILSRIAQDPEKGRAAAVAKMVLSQIDLRKNA